MVFTSEEHDLLARSVGGVVHYTTLNSTDSFGSDSKHSTPCGEYLDPPPYFLLSERFFIMHRCRHRGGKLEAVEDDIALSTHWEFVTCQICLESQK